MDMTTPLYDQYPWWLAVVLALALVLGAAALILPLAGLARHLARRTERDWMRADARAWAAEHPVVSPPPADLGRLTVRSRPAPAARPRCRGQATPPPPEAVPPADGGVATPAATDRACAPDRARPVAPTSTSTPRSLA